MNNSSTAFPKTAAIIVAAGSSTRFRSDKLTALIDGKPLITYTLSAFEKTPLITSIMLVVASGREKEFRHHVDALNNPRLTAMTSIVAGGSSRHDSVRRGLAALDPAISFIAIHDAARPLITRLQIENVCRAAYNQGAAALALPVTETLHRTDANGHAQETVDRDQLWAVQTPQVFRRTDLQNVFVENTSKHFTKNPTDEVTLMRECGISVALIENREPNPKATFQEDLELIEWILMKKIEKKNIEFLF